MIISETPLRISFVGGGTDLASFYRENGGAVINAAIDKYVYVVVKERFDEKIYLNYSRKEIIDSVDEIEHELVREAMKKTGVKAGVEITTLADIPSEGSGLGSSSSITVGLLNALYHYTGQQVTAEQLAQEACEIEIKLCKKPIGKQDQYIAAYGGLKKLSFQEDESVGVEEIALPQAKMREFNSTLMLFYTNKTRKAEDILIKHKELKKEKQNALKENKTLVNEFIDAITSFQFKQVGAFLQKNWELKKTVVRETSNNDIDELYQTAMKAGATGGKICGAGGGGFLLLSVPIENQGEVRGSLKNYRELPFMFEPYGSRIIFNFKRYPSK